MSNETASVADFRPHSSHWGVLSAAMRDGELLVRPHPGDPDPNAIIDNFPAALRHPARVARPMVRRGWLELGPGPDRRRGRDGFVPMPWDASVSNHSSARAGSVQDRRRAARGGQMRVQDRAARWFDATGERGGTGVEAADMDPIRLSAAPQA